MPHHHFNYILRLSGRLTGATTALADTKRRAFVSTQHTARRRQEEKEEELAVCLKSKQLLGGGATAEKEKIHCKTKEIHSGPTT